MGKTNTETWQEWAEANGYTIADPQENTTVLVVGGKFKKALQGQTDDAPSDAPEAA